MASKVCHAYTLSLHSLSLSLTLDNDTLPSLQMRGGDFNANLTTLVTATFASSHLPFSADKAYPE